MKLFYVCVCVCVYVSYEESREREFKKIYIKGKEIKVKSAAVLVNWSIVYQRINQKPESEIIN